MKKSKFLNILICILALVVGLAGGAVGVTYAPMPDTEELIVGEETYYSYNDHGDIQTVELTGDAGEMSIHFLELGNKYTGDCTYIKIGDVDILIDCGSKSSSISTVSAYLDKYVTDDTLEYVIVTHAHQDHYAGFATSAKIDSIFDLYTCEKIITFATTNQKASSTYSGNNIISYAPASKSESTMYNNFNRELNAEVSNGATHITVAQILADDITYPDGKIVLDATNNVNMQILDSKYYYEEAESENDYSVCTMFNYGERYFLMTGDLEEDGEESLVSLNPIFTDLKNECVAGTREYGVELYKAGHHGSKTSSSEILLDHIRPNVVAVCCCAGSSEYTKTVDNQFPTQAFITRVAKWTENIYVTTMCVDYKNNEFQSMNGNIVIVSTQTNVGIKCSNNDTKLRYTDWFSKLVVDETGTERPNRVWPSNS